MKRALLSLAIALSLTLNAFAQDSWDKVLDRYEDICNTCLELRAMIEKGEKVPYASITSVLGEMNTLRAKISSTASEMSPEQRARFAIIRDRYIKINSRDAATSERMIPEAFAGSLPKIETDIIATASQFDAEQNIKSIEPVREIEIRKWRLETMAAFEVSEDFEYGASLSVMSGKFGIYASVMSNFKSSSSAYTCSVDGKTSNGGAFWGDGTVRHSLFSASIGPEYLINKQLGVFAGCGYWSRNTDWRDVSGQWAKVSDLGIKSICLEAGANLRSGANAGCPFCLILGAGARYVPAANAVYPLVRLGVEF